MYFKVCYKHKGKIHHKTLKAENKIALQKELQGTIILSIQEQKNLFSAFKRQPSKKEQLHAFYTFKLGLKAHLPLAVILENIIHNCNNPTLKSQFEEAHTALHLGKDLGSSFKEAGFNAFICLMLDIGQKTNSLLESIEYIIKNLKNAQNTQKLLTKILLYPSIVCIAMVAVFLSITLFVLPQFAVLFNGLEMSLPLVSTSLLFMRKIILDYGIITLWILCVAILIFYYFYKKTSFQQIVDAKLLKIPFLGKVLYYHQMLQFFQNFFWLYRAKVPLQKTLEIAIESLNNAHLKHKAQQIFHTIAQGVPINSAFSASKILDDLSQQVLSSAHNATGFLESLEILLELYDEELQIRSQTLLASIEPLMILVLGAFILWLALGIFLPLWELPLQMQGV